MQTFLSLAKAAVCFVTLFTFNVLNAQQNTKLSNTKYGLYPIKADLDSRLAAANNIGVDYIRTSIALTDWDGVDATGVDYWLDRKKKLVLNISNDTTPYFPINLTFFKSQLNSFLDVYGSRLEMVVIDNEELNNDMNDNLYHLGSLQSYINELSAAVTICNQRKIPITNGGLASQVAASLKHYYDTHNKPDSSAWLVQQMNGIPADSMVWKRCDSLLNAYKTIALSYVNLHWYEPKKGMTRITGVLQTLCNYITTCTGKKTISNETGIKSDSSFMTQLMQQWSLVKPDYCIVFDGNSANAGALAITTSNGSLMPSGMAYRDYVGGGKACKQAITLSPDGMLNSCTGKTIILTAASGFGNYLWNDGETTQSITVKATGNFWVKSTQSTCMAYSNKNASVMMNNAETKPVITSNPSPAINICASKTVKLTSNVATTYLWSTGETTKSIDADTSGNYTVTTSDKNGCKTESDIMAVSYQRCTSPKNLKVTDISSKNATLNWGAVECSKGYQVQYRIKGAVPWTSLNIASGNTSSKKLSGLTAATYQWRMLTYCNYSPDTVKSIYVFGPEFNVGSNKNESNALAVNLDGFNVNIFPVPAKNITSVSVNPVGNNLEITLMDIYGKVLWRKEKITDAVTSLPVANLASGIYLIVIKNEGHSKTMKFAKQ